MSTKHDQATAAILAAENTAQTVVALSIAYPLMNAERVAFGLGAAMVRGRPGLFRFPDGSAIVATDAGGTRPVEYIGG